MLLRIMYSMSLSSTWSMAFYVLQDDARVLGNMVEINITPLIGILNVI